MNVSIPFCHAIIAKTYISVQNSWSLSTCEKKDLDVNDVCSKVNAAFLKAVLPFLSRVENEAINGIEEST